MWLQGILIVSSFILAGMVPLAILISRDRLRRYRRGLLVVLEDWISRTAGVTPLPSFDSARIKYELLPSADDTAVSHRGRGDAITIAPQGSMWGYVLPASIYSGLTGLSFVSALFLATDPAFWQRPNFILSGMFNVSATLTSDLLTIYQWKSGAAITAGFLGAYLFTLRYLVDRVRNYELSPTSFLIASVSILEGTFVVAVARHLVGNTSFGAFTALAFVLGYFPTYGITWLVEHARVQNLKQMAPAAYKRRYVLPTDMVDGIDVSIKFRLMEAGIQDVQNLATANPVLLYVETPFGLLTILDWISQAQLIVAFGGDLAADLRQIGVRTIFDVEGMGTHHITRQMVLRKLWPEATVTLDEKATVEMFGVLQQILAADVHVRRLQSFRTVMVRLVETHDPKFNAGAISCDRCGGRLS
jgi:hypothetical protein